MNIIRWFSLFLIECSLLTAITGTASDQAHRHTRFHRSGSLTVSVSEASYTLGTFHISLTQAQLKISSDQNQTVWESVSGKNFLAGGRADLIAEENRGSFTIEERVETPYRHQTIDSVTLESNSTVLRFSGLVSLFDDSQLISAAYNFTLESDPSDSEGILRFSLVFSDSSSIDVNYLELQFASEWEERFYGFGEQFTHLNLAGKEIPVLTQEQGIGRGKPIITPIVNLIAEGSGGDAFTTYYSSPLFLTSLQRGFLLENTEYSVFNLKRRDIVNVRLFASSAMGRIMYGSSPLELIERVTEYTGRMPALPDWINKGAIVGMQGGTEFVRSVHDQLKARDTPISAFWLQDWVGRRQTAVGSQLWWNWELDEEWYPGWDDLVSTLKNESDAKVMGYISPFLVDRPNATRNLFQEASDLGYLITNETGDVYPITNTDFDAGLMDLTNPNATQWLIDIISENLIGKAGLSGWMADFAEALPFDAVLYSGEDAARFHNEYPVEWARLNREAIEKKFNETGEELIFFCRAGYTQSPMYATLLWGGDQLVTFDEDDGMQSAITSLLSGGYSGISILHSDVGGYTTFAINDMGLKRKRDVYFRWLEMNAFTAVLRTHEGNQPEANIQFYTDDETLDAFARFAKIYAVLAPYRKSLLEDAENFGHPVVRHLAIHYPDDETAHEVNDQFLLGTDILVAPVVKCEARRKWVYLPVGNWVHLWTHELYQNTESGRWLNVKAPIGEIPVFYIQGSDVGATLHEFVEDEK